MRAIDSSASHNNKLSVESAALYALFYHYNSFNVIPLSPGEKKPAVESWQEYAKRGQTREEVIALFEKPGNIAVICGDVSGSLVVLDFDDPRQYELFIERVGQSSPQLLQPLQHSDFRRYKLWIAKTGKGYHVYLRLPLGEDAGFGRTQADNVEVRGNNHYVVAPPSVHPETRKPYEFIQGPTREEVERFVELCEAKGRPIQPLLVPLSQEEWKKVVEALPAGIRARLGAQASPASIEPTLRELIRRLRTEREEAFDKLALLLQGLSGYRLRLSEDEVQRVVNTVLQHYRKGVRHEICRYLSAWGYKADVHPASVLEIIRRLVAATGDEEPEDRAYIMAWYYGLLQGEPPVEKERAKAKTGLYEIFLLSWREKLRESGEEGEREAERRALRDVLQIQDAFRKSYEQDDLIIAVLDEEKSVYAVADMKAGRISTAYLAKGDRGRDVAFKHYVFDGVPEKVIRIVSPIDGSERYIVQWRMRFDQKPKLIGPASKAEIFEEISSILGAVRNKRLAEDVLNAIYSAMVERGLVEERSDTGITGLWWDPTARKVVATGISVEKPAPGELKDALTLLDKIITNFYEPGKREKAATVVKWGIAAAFNFARKQKTGRWIPWLYLYGASHTGKSTLAQIVLSIWSSYAWNEKGGTEVNSQARLGEAISRNTFPLVVQEAGDLVKNDSVVEMIKVSVEQTVARSRINRNRREHFLSLSPVLMTSNAELPRDDVLLRRMVVLHFGKAERVQPHVAEKFEKEVKPELRKLEAIGRFAVAYVVENPEILDQEDWISIAERILEEAYGYAQLPKPDWIKLRQVKTLEEVFAEAEEEVRGEVKLILASRVNDLYARYIGHDQAPPEDRLRTLIENGYMPEAALRREGADEYVLFKREVLRILQEKGVKGIFTLRDLAEAMGWQYVEKVSERSGDRVTSYSAVKVPLKELAGFLFE